MSDRDKPDWDWERLEEQEGQLDRGLLHYYCYRILVRELAGL